MELHGEENVNNKIAFTFQKISPLLFHDKMALRDVFDEFYEEEAITAIRLYIEEKISKDGK